MEAILYRLMVAGADLHSLAGKQAPACLQTGSSAVKKPVILSDGGEIAVIVQGPIPAVRTLAEGVAHGMGAVEVILCFPSKISVIKKCRFQNIYFKFNLHAELNTGKVRRLI